MRPLTAMAKSLCCLAGFGILIVGFDGWASRSRTGTPRMANEFTVPTRTSDPLSEFDALIPAEAIAQFRQLLQSTESSDRTSVPRRFAELEFFDSDMQLESDRIEQMYESVRDAIRDAAQRSGVSIDPFSSFDQLFQSNSTASEQSQ